MEDAFLSIAGQSKGLFKERGSRFLSFAYSVSTEDEVKLIVESLKKEYHDARHHCYAYALGIKGERFRTYDAGEPNHSAGDPILGQIRSKGLTDTLVVVVRYFGGTKLGIPGLVFAYKQAALGVLNNASIIEKIETRIVTVSFLYDSMNAIMSLIKEYDLEIVSQQFELDCEISVKIRLTLSEEFQLRLSKLEKCKITLI